jgi:3',5'-cyclic AMP phosphodiesterase CpdA
VTGCALHLSDLHRGKAADPTVDAALAALVRELAPELVVASGDLANRGRPAQLEEARALLASLDAPVLAVPGNHDLPYTFPARFSRPWQAFEQAFGTTVPVHRSDNLVAVGLNSVRPARHQGGWLPEQQLVRARRELATAPGGALRLVALHHHLAGAPWRAARKLPLRHRDRALAALAESGAELVAGGHIHQSTTVERHEFEALDGSVHAPLVLCTAPGYGRPRPHRTGEAQGLHVYRWDGARLAVETRIWDGTAFTLTAERSFPRGRVQSPASSERREP